MRRKKRRSNPFRILILLIIIGLLIYIDQKVEPFSPYIFLPSPTPTLSPDRFITEAQNYAVEGKYTLALQSYDQAIAADPQDASNYIASAMINVYRGDYEAALEYASNALLLNPENSQAYAIKGISHGLLGDYLDSETNIETAIEYDPSNYFAYAYDAIVKAQKILLGSDAAGDYDAAIESSRKAEAIAPTALETHWARGMVLEITANYEEAVAEYDAAIAVNANVAEIHISLGRTYAGLLEYTSAVEEYTKANALNPTDANPDALIGRTYYRIGEYSKSILYYQQAISDEPTNPYYWGYLGQAYYKNYEFGDAILALQYAIQGGITPDNATVEGLSLSYDVVDFYYFYGLALMKLSYCSDAVDVAQAIIQSIQDDEVAIANAEYILEVCYESMNEQQLLKLPTATMVPTWTPQPSATPTSLPSQVPTTTGD